MPGQPLSLLVMLRSSRMALAPLPLIQLFAGKALMMGGAALHGLSNGWAVYLLRNEKLGLPSRVQNLECRQQKNTAPRSTASWCRPPSRLRSARRARQP